MRWKGRNLGEPVVAHSMFRSAVPTSTVARGDDLWQFVAARAMHDPIWIDVFRRGPVSRAVL